MEPTVTGRKSDFCRLFAVSFFCGIACSRCAHRVWRETSVIAGQVTGARIFCSPGTDDVAQAFRVIPSRMDVSGIDLIFTHRGGSEILPLVFPRLGEELRIVFVDGDSITVPKSNSRHTFSEFVTDPRIARIEFTLTLENGKKVQLVLEHTASGIQLHERK